MAKKNEKNVGSSYMSEYREKQAQAQRIQSISQQQLAQALKGFDERTKAIQAKLDKQKSSTKNEEDLIKLIELSDEIKERRSKKRSSKEASFRKHRTSGMTDSSGDLLLQMADNLGMGEFKKLALHVRSQKAKLFESYDLGKEIVGRGANFAGNIARRIQGKSPVERESGLSSDVLGGAPPGRGGLGSSLSSGLGLEGLEGLEDSALFAALSGVAPAGSSLLSETYDGFIPLLARDPSNLDELAESLSSITAAFELSGDSILGKSNAKAFVSITDAVIRISEQSSLDALPAAADNISYLLDTLAAKRPSEEIDNLKRMAFLLPPIAIGTSMMGLALVTLIPAAAAVFGVMVMGLTFDILSEAGNNAQDILSGAGVTALAGLSLIPMAAGLVALSFVNPLDALLGVGVMSTALTALGVAGMFAKYVALGAATTLGAGLALRLGGPWMAEGLLALGNNAGTQFIGLSVLTAASTVLGLLGAAIVAFAGAPIVGAAAIPLMGLPLLLGGPWMAEGLIALGEDASTQFLGMGVLSAATVVLGLLGAGIVAAAGAPIIGAAAVALMGPPLAFGGPGIAKGLIALGQDAQTSFEGLGVMTAAAAALGVIGVATIVTAGAPILGARVLNILGESISKSGVLIGAGLAAMSPGLETTVEAFGNFLNIVSSFSQTVDPGALLLSVPSLLGIAGALAATGFSSMLFSGPGMPNMLTYMQQLSQIATTPGAGQSLASAAAGISEINKALGELSVLGQLSDIAINTIKGLLGQDGKNPFQSYLELAGSGDELYSAGTGLMRIARAMTVLADLGDSGVYQSGRALKTFIEDSGVADLDFSGSMDHHVTAEVETNQRLAGLMASLEKTLELLTDELRAQREGGPSVVVVPTSGGSNRSRPTSEARGGL